MIDKDTYTPNAKTQKILAHALEHITSVPYAVSTRWVFYRLLQEGYYNAKSDYKNKWCKAQASARHAFFEGWRPDTLADETREAIVRGSGYRRVENWLQGIGSVKCNLDKWFTQPYYVELWYEARAMTDQFAYYTDHITLRPMGGQPSIIYKWRAAKALETCATVYQKPIVVLYFGDLDTAGQTISNVIESDVRKWCNADFTFIWAGLTSDQVTRYHVPENPEKPGQYQWEALTDTAASDIITTAVNPYVRHDAFQQIEAQEMEAETWFAAQVAGLANQWNGGRS